MNKKKMEYTAQQRQVIDEKGKNILVSAAAGSGKTAVLVQRILRIIKEEKVPVTKMLIVTFTNAAAGEMKERIQRALHEEIDRNPEESGFLQEQMSNMQQASISTLHSFCIEFLREYFHFLDISPSFKMTTEPVSIVLRSQAMEEVLERYYEEGAEEFIRLMDAYGGEKSDRNFIDMVDKIVHFIQGQSEPYEWLREKTGFFGCDIQSFLCSELFHYYIETLISELHIICESTREALAVCMQNAIPYQENLQEDLVMISGLKERLINYLKLLRERDLSKELDLALQEYDDILQQIRNSSFGRLKTISKKQKEELFDEETIDEIKEIRNAEVKDKFKKLQLEIGDRDLRSIYLEISALKSSMEELCRFIEDYTTVYQQKKKELELADFSDLEHFALKLLKNETIRTSLKERFDYIFFDEYQDSNSVQETIIEGIRRENNLFFVGDIKQSIYGFRLAEPRLFQRRYRSYAEGEGGRSLKIDLSKNFRSRKEILDFCNDVFYSLMTEHLGEIDYTLEGQALIAGAQFPPQDDGVELLLGEKMQDTAISHHIIAQRILELEGQSLGRGERNLSFRDMVILMRSPKSSVKDLERVLKLYGIPCYVDYSSVGFDVIEIRSLLEYLRVIDNEMRDEALLGAMVSYFGDFDESELAEIRSFDKSGSFYQAVMRYGDREEISDDTELPYERKQDLVEKIQSFFEELERWRKREKLRNLSDFLFELLTETGYWNYQNLLEKGEERVENLKGFLQKAQEYESNGAVGLFGFLHYVDKILKKKGDSLEAMGLSDSADVVRIMSIHKSKGLEFPVVFLTDLNRNFYFADNRDAIVLHNELGIGMRCVDLETNTYRDSFVKKLIQKKKRRELLSEEVRILYVAMTRAVDKLILVGETTDVAKSLQHAYRGSLREKLENGTSYLSWFLPILVRQRSSQDLRMLADLIPEEAKMLEGESKYFVKLVKEEDIEGETEVSNDEMRERIETFLTAEGDEKRRCEIRERLEERCSYRYPFEEEVHLPYKKGVSKLIVEERLKEESGLEERQGETVEVEMAENEDDRAEEPKEYRLPRFMKEESEPTSAEKGSIAHFVIRSLELRSYTQEEVQEKVRDMVQRELLTDQEGKQVELSWPVGFFNSKLGKRVLASDRVYRERAFMMKYDNYLLEGIIDCYFFEGEKLILFDFKTDRKMDREKHRRQMQLYAQALEKNYHRKVDEVHIFWLRYGKSSRLW